VCVWLFVYCVCVGAYIGKAMDPRTKVLLLLLGEGSEILANRRNILDLSLCRPLPTIIQYAITLSGDFDRRRRSCLCNGCPSHSAAAARRADQSQSQAPAAAAAAARIGRRSPRRTKHNTHSLEEGAGARLPVRCELVGTSTVFPDAKVTLCTVLPAATGLGLGCVPPVVTTSDASGAVGSTGVATAEPVRVFLISVAPLTSTCVCVCVCVYHTYAHLCMYVYLCGCMRIDVLV